MGYLNPETQRTQFSKHGHFWQDQISKTIWCRPNMLMDIWDRTIFQGPFGLDQTSLWTFWTGPNIHWSWSDVQLQSSLEDQLRTMVALPSPASFPPPFHRCCSYPGGMHVPVHFFYTSFHVRVCCQRIWPKTAKKEPSYYSARYITIIIFGLRDSLFYLTSLFWEF